MNSLRCLAWLALGGLLAVCEDEPVGVPWWPAPGAFAPSPLLDAVALPPSAWAAASCRRGPFLGPRVLGWHGAVRQLTDGTGMRCLLARTQPPGGPPYRGPRELAVVGVDSRGRVASVSRMSAGRSAIEAAAAADRLLRDGLRLPGARPLRCDARRAAGGAETTRGWQTPFYQALVTVQHTWPLSERGYVAHVQVSRGAFVICRHGDGVSTASLAVPAA